MAFEEGRLRLDRGDPPPERVHGAQGELPQALRGVGQAPGLQQRPMRVDAHAQRAMGVHGLGQRDPEGRSARNVLHVRPSGGGIHGAHARPVRSMAPSRRESRSAPCS